MKCFICGAENTQNSQFCLNCGNKLQNDQMPQQQNYNQLNQGQMQYNQQPKKNHTPVIVICSILGVLVVLSVLALIFVPIVFNVIYSAKKVEVSDRKPEIVEESTNKNQKEEKYSIGDPVTLVDGSEWHVIGKNGDKIVLILDELLVEETGYGKTANPEDQKYENSLVKEYIDNTYTPSLKKSLKASGGDTNIIVRILSSEDFIKGTGKKYGAQCYYSVTSSTNVFYDYKNKKFTEHYVYEGADKLSSQDKFIATLALTGNFWTMSNVTERTASECTQHELYKGAYYIETEVYNGYSGSTSAYANLEMDWEAVYYTSSGENFGDEKGTSAGIRPVIETSLKNIK